MIRDREELWAEYVRQNPSFAGDKPVKITPDKLRKMFNLTWDISAKREAAFRDHPGAPPVDFGDLFKGLFGAKP